MRMSEEEYSKRMTGRSICRTPSANAHNRVSMPPQVKQNALEGKCGAFANIPLESWEQMQVVNWMHSRGHRVHHSPNGGKRSKAEAGRFKAEGVAAGFPDLICFPSNQNSPILFLEMKRIKNSATTFEQKVWNHFLNGYQFSHSMKAFVCKGHQEAIQLLVEHGY